MKRKDYPFGAALFMTFVLVLFGSDIEDSFKNFFKEKYRVSPAEIQADIHKKEVFQKEILPLYSKVTEEEKRTFNHPIHPLWENITR